MPRKTVLVIGSSSGIGNILLNGLSAIHTTYASSRKPNSPSIIELDLQSIKSIDSFSETLRKKLLEKGNKIDLLIMNSGISLPASIIHSDMADVKSMFDINIVNQIILLGKIIPFMNANSKLIFINSKSAKVTLPFLGVYSATKHAMLAISNALRLELKPLNISVTSLCIGNVKTGMWRNILTNNTIAKDNPTYNSNIDKALDLAKSKYSSGMEPKVVLDLILKLETKTTLKNVYYLGKDTSRILWLQTLLPNYIFEKLIRKKYEL